MNQLHHPPLLWEAGLFGFGYNRVNYKFDQGQRWARFTAGRANELKRFAMFREDVSDLAAVPLGEKKSRGSFSW